jgi:CubicO group peptidase (beta-lactamase class C family)
MSPHLLARFPLVAPTLLAALALGAPSGPAPAGAQPAPAVVASPVAPSTAPADGVLGPTDPLELEAFLDGWFAAYLEKVPAAGATVAVVRDGKVLLAKGYGFADLETRRPVDPDRTLFRIGSVSKLFVWTSVMQLVEQGRLELDRDVNDYLTAFEVPAAFGQPVTLAHLLSHTAGFEDRVIGLFARDESDLAPLADVLRAELPARVRPPGEFASYSNHGTALAMLVVEEVAGVPWQEYVQRFVIEPLGLGSTTFAQPVPEPMRERLSQGYRPGDGELVAQDFEMTPLAPAGAVSSTATDMARLMLAFLGRGAYGEARILRADTTTQMMSELHRHAPEVSPMAHGLIDSSTRGVRIVGHGGDTFWFHSAFELFPEHDLGLFASINTQGANPYDLVEAFVERYFPAPPEASPLPTTAAELERFAGAYRMNRYDHRSLAKLIALLGAVDVEVSDDGKALVTRLDRKTRWLPVAPLVFQEEHGDRKLVFRETGGRVTHGFLSDLPILALERVPPAERRSLHLPLLGLALAALAVTLAFWPLAWLARRRYRVRLERGRRLPAATRWLLLVPSALLLAFAFGLAVSLSDPTAVVFGVPRSLAALLALPVLAAPLLLAALVAAFRAWRRRQGTFPGRLAYSLGVLTGLAFLWQLWVWNLLGWRL